MSDDPFSQFDEWYAEARRSEINDSNAMALATADADGRPSVRMVLLKGHGPEGFIFYTNFEGRKAGDLLVNPNAALLFHWKSLRRQIRIEGCGGPGRRCHRGRLFRYPQPRQPAGRMGV